MGFDVLQTFGRVAFAGPLFFARVGDYLQHNTIADAPLVVRLLAPIMTSVGKQISHAQDMDELDECLDSATNDLFNIRRAITEINEKNINYDLAVHGWATANLTRIVGAESTAAIQATQRVYDHVSSTPTPPICVPGFNEHGKHVPQRLHSYVRRVYKSTLCGLAIGETVRRNKPIDAWFAQALCERALEGARIYAAFVAVVSSIDIPDLIVPSAYKTDIAALYAQYCAKTEAAKKFVQHTTGQIVRSAQTFRELCIGDAPDGTTYPCGVISSPDGIIILSIQSALSFLHAAGMIPSRAAVCEYCAAGPDPRTLLVWWNEKPHHPGCIAETSRR